jgi:hypothetical protein
MNARFAAALTPLTAFPTHRNHAAPGQTPPDYYTSNATRSTFIYNSDMFNSTQGYARCNDLGGSLASWDSITEQYEVEQYFINSGSIMPKKYGRYLYGYNKTSPDATQYTWQVRWRPWTAIQPAMASSMAWLRANVHAIMVAVWLSSHQSMC